MIISLIVATSKNRVIGVNNDLPWRLKTDMQYFMNTTNHHPVIMGSRTYESIPPKLRPLPNRTNIILTRDSTKKYDRCLMAATLGEAIQIANEQPGADEIFILGGGTVFAQALPLAHRVYLTEVQTEIKNGDTYFPELDEIRWQKEEIGRFEKGENDDHSGIFYLYNRTDKYPITQPDNARNETYKKQLQQILESGICPFCPDGVTVKDQPIIKENQSWFATYNAHPLANTITHIMVTAKRHFTTIDDLSPNEWADFVEIKKSLKEIANMTGDVTYGRSGEPLVTGATVSHFHFHIIVPVGLAQVSFGHFQPEKS